MSEVKRYRKKPVVIEAMQYEGGPMGWGDVHTFVGNDVLFPYFMDPGSQTIHIQTLECLMPVTVGSWIVKGVNGEFYLVKDDIFKKTYEEET